MDDRSAPGSAPAELHARDIRLVESREEITLIFGAGRPSSSSGAEFIIDTASQIVLSPPAAKRFLLVLKDMLARHEAVHGAIGAPSGAEGRTGQGLPQRTIAASPASNANPVDLLRQLVDDLGADYGLEYSFKIFPGAILDNRYLIAVNRKAIPGNAAEKLLNLCRRINMPQRFERIYFENLSDANIVLFGYEGNEASGTYKVYLEFGSMFETGLRGSPGEPVSFLIHFGFKWDAEDNRRAALARYTCYPTLSTGQILERMRDRFYAGRGMASYEVVRGIVERAEQAKKPEENFLYVEVKEEGNPRQSYDINLYRANLSMEDMYSWLREACRIQGVDAEAFHRVYEPMKKKIFGHVSGGFDRSGRDFLTFYYGLRGSTR